MRKRKSKTDNVNKGKVATVTINNLNVRKGPGKEYKKIGFITPGQYTIVEFNSDSGYGKLENGYWICVRGINGVEFEEPVSKKDTAVRSEEEPVMD